MSEASSPTTPSKGHPKGLYVLFGAEMFERLCYYGMRALLVLYLTKSLMKGDTEALGIYGAYTALVYAAPVVGGKVADAILGYRRAVIFGGLLMALGEFTILLGTEFGLFAGMALIIVGNGYFKANISTIVGRLYEDGDPKRDSGFTIFYMGINLGAFLATAPIIGVGPMGEKFGFTIGFGIAGVGMLLGIAVFMLGRGLLQGHGEAPDEAKLKKYGLLTYAASIAAAPVLYFLLVYGQALLFWLLLGTLLVVVVQLLSAGFKAGREQRDRIIVLLILMVFNVTFWACFEQAGGSLTLFADRNVDRDFLGLFELTASATQSFNPIFILLFGSLFTWLWVFLDKKNLNPNIPMKFGLGIMQLGFGFVLLWVGAASLGDSVFRMPVYFLIFAYMLHTTGELFLSPIGLSMVTKLAPKHMTGSVMGAWFLSFAFSNYLAAAIGKLTGTHSEPSALGNMVGAAKKALIDPPGAIESMTNHVSEVLAPGYFDALDAAAKANLESTVPIYEKMGWATVAIGAFLVLGSRLLNKMMHGVK